MDIKTIIFLGLMVISGSLNTIFSKIIEDPPYLYYHGFFNSWLMFIGEIIPLFILNISLMLNKIKKQNHIIETIKIQKNEDKKPVTKNWIVGIGSIFDFLASTCNTLCFIFLPASVGQIGRGGIILTVTIYSYFLLKKRYTKKQMFGIALVILGLLVVFLGQHYVQIRYEKDHPKKNKNYLKESSSSNGLIFGVVLLLISWIIQGFQMVYQEKILNKYEVNLNRYVGLEGIYGLFFSAICLFFTGMIPCKYDFCANVNGHDYFVDNPSSGITEMFNFQNKGLFFLNIGFVFSITIFNITGLYITQKLSALFRMIMDNIRSIVIWLFFMIIGSKDEYFCVEQLIKLLGFIIFILGTLFYNKIIGGSEEDKLEIKKGSKGSKVLSSLKR